MIADPQFILQIYAVGLEKEDRRKPGGLVQKRCALLNTVHIKRHQNVLGSPVFHTVKL